MEIGKQLKKLRADNSISQDELAEKIYVSRQTISNWENNKSYPDVKSLLLISNLFNTTLDIIVKGDIEEMKQEIKTESIKQFQKQANVFAVLFLCTILLPIPLAKFLGFWGYGVWGIIAAASIFYAIKLEKLKNTLNVQTYKEIVAFVEGKQLSREEKSEEKGKRGYEKIFLAVGAALLTILIAVIMILIF